RPTAGRPAPSAADRQAWRDASASRSGEQQRRQHAAALERCRVPGAPGLEQLEQLLARCLVVPGAVALHRGDERLGRLEAEAAGIEGDGELVAGLVVVGVLGDLLLELGGRRKLRRL